MADSKWRIEIYEIKWFRSLKILTRGFQNCWLRKWGRKIDIFIYKMPGRFKMANWNLRGKQYWSLKFCTWEFFESLSTNACVQYAKFFLCITKVNLHESIYWSSINKLKFLRVGKFLFLALPRNYDVDVIGFCPFWGALFTWVPSPSTIRVALLTWVPLPLTIRSALLTWDPLPLTFQGA